MKKSLWIAPILLMLAPAMAFAVPGTVEVDIDGTMVSIDYDAVDVSVLSVSPDLDFVSLIFDVDVTGSPGFLEITFDRSVFDAIINGNDDEFIILADGDEPQSEEISTTAESRTLRFELPFGTEDLEIIGTDFGTEDEPIISRSSVPKKLKPWLQMSLPRR